jgi:hypothetical protein
VDPDLITCDGQPGPCSAVGDVDDVVEPAACLPVAWMPAGQWSNGPIGLVSHTGTSWHLPNCAVL